MVELGVFCSRGHGGWVVHITYIQTDTRRRGEDYKVQVTSTKYEYRSVGCRVCVLG